MNTIETKLQRNNSLTHSCVALTAGLAVLGLQTVAAAAEHGHDQAEDAHADSAVHLDSADHGDSHHGLHFSPPLIAKNPTPVTEVRTDYFFSNLTHEEGEEHTFRIVGEYAFSRNFSMEVAIPYTTLKEDHHDAESHLNNIAIGLKLASFAFEDAGIVVGGGFEVFVPTGSHEKGIGSDEAYELEPFVNLGWKKDKIEAVFGMGVGFPSEGDKHEPDSELLTNVSLLYHASDRIRPFVEYDGEKVYGGDHGGDFFAAITPGVKVQPFANNSNLEMGVGLSFPITNKKEFHTRVLFSLFYHF